MSKYRHRSRRPKDKNKRRILNSVKETCVQLKSMGLTYNEIADKTNLGYSTIYHICNVWAPQNPDRVKQARARALEELAGLVSKKAMEALDHITPDSMTHDRIVQRNANGDITGVQHSGPNSLQLSTQAAILIDKSLVLNDKAGSLRGESPELIGPADFAQLLGSIQDRIKYLTNVKADLVTGELQARIIEFQDKVNTDTEIPADFELLEREESGSDS